MGLSVELGRGPGHEFPPVGAELVTVRLLETGGCLHERGSGLGGRGGGLVDPFAIDRRQGAAQRASNRAALAAPGIGQQPAFGRMLQAPGRIHPILEGLQVRCTGGRGAVCGRMNQPWQNRLNGARHGGMMPDPRRQTKGFPAPSDDRPLGFELMEEPLPRRPIRCESRSRSSGRVRAERISFSAMGAPRGPAQPGALTGPCTAPGAHRVLRSTGRSPAPHSTGRSPGPAQHRALTGPCAAPGAHQPLHNTGRSPALAQHRPLTGSCTAPGAHQPCAAGRAMGPPFAPRDRPPVRSLCGGARLRGPSAGSAPTSSAWCRGPARTEGRRSGLPAKRPDVGRAPAPPVWMEWAGIRPRPRAAPPVRLRA